MGAIFERSEEIAPWMLFPVDFDLRREDVGMTRMEQLEKMQAEAEAKAKAARKELSRLRKREVARAKAEAKAREQAQAMAFVEYCKVTTITVGGGDSKRSITLYNWTLELMQKDGKTLP